MTAGHSHDHDHDHSHSDPEVLHATGWHNWAPAQITDGIIDVWISPDLPAIEYDFAAALIQEIDEIIGTPVRLSIIDQADIKVHRSTMADYVQHGTTTAFGLAYSEGSVAHATWANEPMDKSGYQNAAPSDPLVGPLPQRFTPAPVHPLFPQPQELSIRGKNVITHEILHTFGLSHPLDDGNAPGFDWSDTAMSYNLAPFTGSGITHLDTLALASIWS